MAEATVVKKVSASKLIVALLKDKVQCPEGLDTPAKDIIEKMKTLHGLTPTEQLINNVKFQIRKNRADKKAGVAVPKAKKRRRPMVPVNAVPTISSEVDRLIAVRTFAQTVGGLDALQSSIDSLRKLDASSVQAAA